MGRAYPEGARTYEALLTRARDDPAILAFWLGGSRGMGRPTEHSDWDVGILVTEDAYEPFCREIGLEGPFQADWRPGVDLMVRTLPMFEAFGAWESDERAYRYAYAHLTALVDKTGRAQPMIDAKACVPADAVPGFIHASLDHALNQAYRALKCLRDGDPVASRLEAADGVNPYFDAVFALHGGRLRPYAKYLRWELETWPLARLPTGDAALMDRALGVLGRDGGPTLSTLLAEARVAFRAAGQGAAYDGWGETLDWILTGRPDATP
ncbi:MAG TPA: nucleotidyltransferase domain-containing protein [Caulobacteraceae bacterium]|jgi:predicted nucleotidyltransferase